MRSSPPNRARWLALGALMLLAACTTARRQALLTFFFDGVPPPAGTASPGAPAAPTNGAARVRPPVVIAPGFVHEPYLERDCRSCHASERTRKVKGPLQDVCFGCHDNFLADRAVRHDPAAEGQCGACHEPHRSEFSNLLVRASAQLCLDCHDAYTGPGPVHEPARVGNCTACHDPHATALPHLLRRAGDALCVDCHAPAEMAALPRHAEAAGRACLDCHAAHASRRAGLLR